VSSAPPLGVPNPHSRGSFQNLGSVSSRQSSQEAAEQSAPIDINDTLLASLCLSLSVTFRSAPSLTLSQCMPTVSCEGDGQEHNASLPCWPKGYGYSITLAKRPDTTSSLDARSLGSDQSHALCVTHKTSVLMHAQFTRIHHAAYPDGDLVQVLALSALALVMHPIVRTHMRSALQSLGVTDHPHEAKTLLCPCVNPDKSELVMMNYECLSAWRAVGPRSWYNYEFRGIHGKVILY
jgi:hypothetical protein